jgi:hypothetical protein
MNSQAEGSAKWCVSPVRFIDRQLDDAVAAVAEFVDKGET